MFFVNIEGVFRRCIKHTRVSTRKIIFVLNILCDSTNVIATRSCTTGLLRSSPPFFLAYKEFLPFEVGIHLSANRIRDRFFHKRYEWLASGRCSLPSSSSFYARSQLQLISKTFLRLCNSCCKNFSLSSTLGQQVKERQLWNMLLKRTGFVPIINSIPG